jgi:DNA-binding MarR family transcriptional regulator
VSRQEEENKTRQELLDALQLEARRQSAYTLFLHDAIAGRLGLNITDHKCLDILIQAGTMTPGELARQTNLTTGAVTGVIDRLERHGLVVREHDAADRRRVLVRPLEARCTEKIGPLFDELVRCLADLCSSYDDDELRVLIDFYQRSTDMIRRVTADLRAEASAPSPEVRDEGHAMTVSP